MTNASLSAAAWAAPGKVGLLAGGAMHALLGWSAVWLPAAMSGASRWWVWSTAGAVTLAAVRLAGSQWPAARLACASSARCALALCVAASIDFFLRPPDLLLSLCSASASWSAQLQLLVEYLGALPVSSVAMVALALLETASRHGRMHTLSAALTVGEMLAAMLFAIWALPWLARSLHWSWTADAVVYAMIFSMVLLHLLRIPLSRISITTRS